MSSLEEQLHMMQQQIAALQEQLHEANTTPMQSADDTATTLPLHSMGTRTHYDWSPSDGLTELMNLDTPLHTAAPLSDSERKTIIEAYPPMAHLDYKAPATIPTAERLLSKGQRYEDHSLKHLQYLLSAVYRPLDILAHELVSSEVGNPNLERYCTMLQDVRKLLLHVGSSMNQIRNNIALRAIDPSFSMQPGTEVNYTLPLNEFQDTLIQQTAARKATRDATVNKRQRRRFPKGNTGPSNSFSNVSEQQFFRPGPPSQQGGFSNNHYRRQLYLRASSRALDMGVPQDGIVALGNWASSDTFVRHYQRNQMAQVDFTSTVLSSQDEFFDANDSFGTLD